MLVQSFSGLKKVKDTVEIKIKEFTAKVKVLNEQLLIERQVAISAATTAKLVIKENAAIKQAMQAIGCTFHFTERDHSTIMASSFDEDEFRLENTIAADSEGEA